MPLPSACVPPTPPDLATLHLDALVVRHGESEWNALGRWQGHADPPLSELGVEQARLAARSLGGFDAIASSDLQRAAVTAELLAAELGIGPVHVDPRLRETHAGEWQGLTHAEIEQQWPGFLEAGDRPPGFEQPEQTAERAWRALCDLARRCPGGTALVVSHSGTIRSLRRMAGVPMSRMPNLAGTWLHLRQGALVVGDEVHLLERETLADTD